MKRFTLTVMMIAGLALQLFGKGSAANCEEHAESVSFKDATRTVTLVPEYDYDSGTYDYNRGVYYFKSKLDRGSGYTVWTTGLSTNDDVTVTATAADSDDDDKDGPGADFSEVDEPAGNTRLVMYADDWTWGEDEKDENDPKSWTFYFELEGEVGQQVTVHFRQGAIIPVGREENPQTLYPTLKEKTVSSKLQLDSSYYCRVNFKAGQLYWFATQGGTETSLLGIDLDDPDNDNAASEDAEEVNLDYTIYPDPNYDDDPLNTGMYVVANVSGWYNVVINAEGEDADEAPFSISFRTWTMRKPAEHPSIELNEANNYTAEFTAGHMNTAENMAAGFYDSVVDESLFRFTAKKGRRYLVESVDAQTNLFIAVYDAKGKITNWNVGDGQTMESRVAFAAESDGDCYVGVCQNIADDFSEEPAYTKAKVRITDASAVEGQPDAWDPRDDEPAGANGLCPIPGQATDSPELVDPTGTDYHELGKTDWADVFMIGARKDVTYALRVSLEDPEHAFNSLKAQVFTLSGSKEVAVVTEGDVNAGSAAPLTFTATMHATYYVRLKVAGGQGLDYPKYKVHAMAYSSLGLPLGILTVNTLGVSNGSWSLDREKVKYPGGASVLVSGSHTVNYGAVKGFRAPAKETAAVVAGKIPTVLDRYYTDTFDPKDDTAAGATAWALKNTETEMSRTFWKTDREDNFSFSAKDGQYFDFALRNATGDAVFTITNAVLGVLAKDVKSVSHLELFAVKPKYYLTVHHAENEPVDGSYRLAGRLANVGTIKFAKAAVAAKEDAATVAISVNRTAKDGKVRVKYGTVAGTAAPGVDYVAQNGILEWADGDNKAKTIQVKLIPDLVPAYEGDKTFSVRLEPLGAEERKDDEYPATVVDGGLCTVTLKETAKKGVTVEDAYAKYRPKAATTKTEEVPLASGTFSAVLEEDGAVLTNGQARLASVSFTASAATPAKLSAKVALAGKNYTFTATGWDAERSDGEVCVQTLKQIQKVGTTTYENTLVVTVAAGATAGGNDWLKAGGRAELTMNVPDAKGVQKDIRYVGDLFRDNAKIQDYLTAVAKFAGYYTVALVPDAVVGDGVPAGNGYLTLTADAKGTVKVAGLLADGTKISLSPKACALREDASSGNGYSLYVPLFQAKAPSCFGGVLRLFARTDDGTIVVDTEKGLVWNNDNRALTHDNKTGYRIALAPVGGWYDMVVALQTFYLTRRFEIATVDAAEFPAEAVAKGFDYVKDVGPNGDAVDLSGNAFSVPKQALAKPGKLYDLAASVNPSAVQFKFTRATGLLSGTFSVWTSDAGGTAQKAVSGSKFNGVLLPARAVNAALDDEVVVAGFFTLPVTVTDVNPNTGATSQRKWTFSAPFNVLGIDLGAVDWWSEDWGVKP